LREIEVKRFIEGKSRTQSTLLPECLDDYIAVTNPVRVVDVNSANWGFPPSSCWVFPRSGPVPVVQAAISRVI